MELSIVAGKISPLHRGQAAYESHLLFADDLLLFTKANKGSFTEINFLLQKLACNIGLSINREKSKCYFSKSCRNKASLKACLDIPEGYIPSKYLGIPLSINYLKASNFSSC